MKKKLNCILLIDDSPEANRFNQIIIKGMNITNSIQFAQTGVEAMEYLKKENQIIPEIIFLDISMPKMNGWEFLEEYKFLEEKQKAKTVILMLTTSVNPDDEEKAKLIQEISGYQNHPLSKEKMTEILEQYFPDYVENIICKK